MNNLLSWLFPASATLNSKGMSVSLGDLCALSWFKAHLVVTFQLSACYFSCWGLSLMLGLLLRYDSISHIINKSSWIDWIFKWNHITLRPIPSWQICRTLLLSRHLLHVIRYVFFNAFIKWLVALIRLMAGPSLLKQTRSGRILIICLMWLWVFQ